MNFCLRGMQEEGESKVLPPSRRYSRRRKQRVVNFKKIVKEERVKGCRFREDSQGEESKVLPLSKR